jgi:hypothetical protein
MATKFNARLGLSVGSPAIDVIDSSGAIISSSAAITGGTIDNTSIGATTPSTVNATTITGQTARLNGTGQNLLLQSGWAGGTSGTVGSGAVAPTSSVFIVPSGGGSVTYAPALSGSGNSIRFIASSERPGIQQSLPANFVVGITYSIGVNVETVTSGTHTLSNLVSVLNTTATPVYYVNGVLSTGSTVATSNSTIQVVIPVTATSGTSVVRFGLGVNGPATGDITLSNPQIEIGSTLNTYIPTTTTAVYGTPTLSFSGVSSIGLLSNGALYLEPAGTGALQAQATTSTAAGGNVRGANAVDWQTTRSAASQVASSAYSVIGGGQANTASGFGASVVGGVGSLSTGGYSFVGGGLETSARLGFSTAVGGFRNNAAGQYGFIGGGYSNLTTSNTAVTTQAAATNGVTSGSTAVTLAASNASIRVGQVIFGTGILGYPNETYVAAISGTSLTLSQNANATGTPTLSFFTPHGVVVGGGNNQATGSYSFIGGGGDAGTAANRNVASGDFSVVVGGQRNTASGIYATVAGGANSVASGQGAFVGGGGWFGSGVSTNTASGTSSFIGAGYGNTASGFCASVVGGSGNTANQNFNSVLGGASGIGRSIAGYTAFPASANPLSSVQGSSQTGLLVLARQTTDATPTALASDTSAASTTNQVILPNNSAYYFKGSCIANVTGGGNTKSWAFEGAIKRGANAASTSIVGGVVILNTIAEDAGASGWVLAITADTTNGGIRVTVTGQTDTTIRWVAKLETTEVTY